MRDSCSREHVAIHGTGSRRTGSQAGSPSGSATQAGLRTPAPSVVQPSRSRLMNGSARTLSRSRCESGVAPPHEVKLITGASADGLDQGHAIAFIRREPDSSCGY